MELKEASKTTILIVDPSAEERTQIVHAFEGLGYELLEAAHTADAFRSLEKKTVDLIISELVLTDVSGFAFCRELRDHPATQTIPIMLISHWYKERDRILAFEVGADDFCAKPFFARELTARVRAVLRRCANHEAEPLAENLRAPAQQDDFDVRHDSNEIHVQGRVIPLTRREFAIVIALMKRRGRVVGRDELISQVWGDLEVPHARSVDAHIKSIRRKLGHAGGAIETIRGLGYRFTDDPVQTLPLETASAISPTPAPDFSSEPLPET